MLLIDASVYIFRAFHALPSSIRSAQGQPLNAVHGYGDFLIKVLARENPAQVVAAFDESLTTSFRNQIYADYKATRETPPAELVAQLAACRRLSEALGVATIASPVYEADDLIGTLLQDSAAATVVSSDKDLAQLLRPGDTLWDYGRDVRYDRAAITQRFGVACEQIPDYLALVGDNVDNIPGVAGIGAKTAAALLGKYESLDAMLGDLDGVAASGLRGAKSLADKLAKAADQARLSKRLATIVTDIELRAEQRETARRAVDAAALTRLCDDIGAGQGLRDKLAAARSDRAA